MTLSETGATVVVADDDSLIRMTMRRALSGRGLEVVEAVDGTSAVHAVVRYGADLLITDAHMPGLSLPDMLSAIAELENSPAVLVVSGDTNLQLFPGVSSTLTKPVELDTFLDTVDMLLDRREPSQ